MNGSNSQEHILLSNMGANAPRMTTYQLGDEMCAYQFSAVALWKLLPIEQRPTETLSKAASPGDVLRCTMTNDYTGIEEFASLVHSASLWLFEADEIHANLTGGTTLMGVLVGELVKRAAREYQRRVREFVLNDQRPPEEQRTAPWQLGAIHYLDGQTEERSNT
ncbi:MAG: hypothetical protein WD049_05510 [Candidatus Paceibacterota bacterium]